MTSRRRSSRRMRPNARKRGSRIKGAIPGYGLNDFGEVVVLHGGSHGKPISQSGRGARYVRLERLADRYGRKSFTFEGQTFRKDRSGWHLAGAGAVRPNSRRRRRTSRRMRPNANFQPADWSKALEEYVFNNPIPAGDRWDIVILSHDEFKVKAVNSVMYLHAKAYYVGTPEAVISVIGRTFQNKNFRKQLPLNNKTVPALIALLNKARGAR